MQTISIPGRLNNAGYTLSQEGDFFRIDGTGILLHWQTCEKKYRYADALFEQLSDVLRGSRTAYRGIPRWHDFYEMASMGMLQPLGHEPVPGFVTAGSSYIPFSLDHGTALFAAKAATGSSNPGRQGKLDDVHGYDPGKPTSVRGIVVSVTVDKSSEIAFFNTSELQIRGPIDCSVDTTVINGAKR